MYLLESPHRGDSNKYTKRMIMKELFKISVIHALDGTILSFFKTANSILVTNSVVITKVLCNTICRKPFGKWQDIFLFLKGYSQIILFLRSLWQVAA